VGRQSVSRPPVGWGLGTAVFPVVMFQGQARAVLRRDGTGLVEVGAHDMGQGAWTALAQIAADSLGLELDQLEFRSFQTKATKRRCGHHGFDKNERGLDPYVR
jgi:CO/xanthine dehydrogenase Mo-binding subunit